jgi:hypothetical protein
MKRQQTAPGPKMTGLGPIFGAQGQDDIRHPEIPKDRAEFALDLALIDQSACPIANANPCLATDLGVRAGLWVASGPADRVSASDDTFDQGSDRLVRFHIRIQPDSVFMGCGCI